MNDVLHEIQSVGIGIEPFTEPQSQLDNSSAILNWLSGTLKEVHLIAVVNPEDLRWPGDIEDDGWAAEIQRRVIEDLKARFKVPNADYAIYFDVLIRKIPSRSKTVKHFLSFATEQKIDLLIIHSHTKSDLLTSLGSFCNNVVALSRLPILIIPIGIQIRYPLKLILFPTDFSGLSKVAYEAVVQWAKPLQSAIKIYHRTARPIDEVMQIALHPFKSKAVMPADIVILNDSMIEAKARSWTDWASSVGGTSTFVQDTEKVTLPGSIAARAKKDHVDLIVLPTHTSELNIVSVGSAVCHLLRASSVPVLVIPCPYVSPGNFPNE